MTFKPPTVEEVRAYVTEINANLDPEDFIDYNQKRGWTVGKYGKAPMQCWKSAVRICVRYGYAKTAKSMREYRDRNQGGSNYRQKARKDYGDWLRGKKTRALEDLYQDWKKAHPRTRAAQMFQHLGWLIREIQKERKNED